MCIPLAAAGAAIAIPLYQDYHGARRSCNDAVQSGRNATSGRRRLHAPAQDAAAQPRGSAARRPASPHLREAVITREGTIVLTLAIAKLEGKRITFVPTGRRQDKIVWTCTERATYAQTRYLPRQCRSRSERRATRADRRR